MHRYSSSLAGISLVLLLAFCGQMTAHVLEQSGWIPCASAVECCDHEGKPDDAGKSSQDCNHSLCPHQMAAVLWAVPSSDALTVRLVFHARQAVFMPESPVFDIDHPPQVG
jgi:hypothetical protein